MKNSLNKHLTFNYMSIKWIILDAMGVIFEEGYDLDELLIPFVQKRNKSLSSDFIQDLYIKTSLGKFPSKELWNRLGFDKDYPQIEKEYLDSCLRIDPEFIVSAKELEKCYSLALLSNDVKEWSIYLRNKFEINHFFKIIVISGEVGFRKPDKRIFKMLLERILAPPEVCLFIDDNLNNLNSASELGIKTIRFVRNKSKTPFCSEFEISRFPELLSVIKNFY
ncbi:MAG: HAD family hydrolase [Promethearchaeota archaeon]